MDWLLQERGEGRGGEGRKEQGWVSERSRKEWQWNQDGTEKGWSEVKKKKKNWGSALSQKSREACFHKNETVIGTMPGVHGTWSWGCQSGGRQKPLGWAAGVIKEARSDSSLTVYHERKERTRELWLLFSDVLTPTGFLFHWFSLSSVFNSVDFCFCMLA